MRKIFFAADAANTSGGSDTASPATGTHTRHISNLPAKDSVLASVCEAVAVAWAANSDITLVWIKQADFAADADEFQKSLAGRNTAGGMVSQLSQAVEAIDKQIDDALPYVKVMIAGKYGPKNAVAYYPQFGFKHTNNHYDLPQNRKQRMDALNMMADGIAANGFGSSDYGTAFWANIITQYTTAVNNASGGAGDVSGGVSGLVQLRSTLRRVLHSILLLLEANYPDTHEQVRREWGFQKETY